MKREILHQGHGRNATGVTRSGSNFRSARNLKFYPLSLREALNAEPSLAAAREIEVSACDGRRGPLVALDAWSLFNMKVDDILALPARITATYGISAETITAAMARHSLQNLGIQQSYRQGAEQLAAPVILVPATKHYSFPKAAAVLGIGAANVLDVPVDSDARMSLPALEQILRECLRDRRPVYTVVAVMGSTEESAVDPLKAILELRHRLQREGLSFTVHADAAWGGYFASILRPDEGPPAAGAAPMGLVTEIGMSRYVTSQFSALGRADSITVDPHKSGYIPYPAGALAYRNSAMRDLVTFKAPYIVHGDAEPTVGIYGLEGSKPGAAVAAVYLSHKVIRPTRSGYGQLHRKALFNCKRFYARILGMAGHEDRFIIVPVPRLPTEIMGGDVDTEAQFIRQRIDRRSIDELLADPEAMALLPEIGPDLNILTYAVNFKHPDGSLNMNLELANRLNRTIYDLLSIDPGDDIYGYRMIVSTTDFSEEHYGKTFIEDYKQRLGVSSSPGTTVTVLRSTTMAPWLLETPEGSMLDVLELELRHAIFKSMMRDSMFKVFEEIDENADGVLEVAEIMKRFREQGYKDAEVDQFLSLCDIDRNGTVSLDEFLGSFAHFMGRAKSMS